MSVYLICDKSTFQPTWGSGSSASGCASGIQQPEGGACVQQLSQIMRGAGGGAEALQTGNLRPLSKAHRLPKG